MPHSPLSIPVTTLSTALSTTIATALTTAVALAVTASPASARPVNPYAEQVVSTANEVRSDHGLRTLRTVRCLERRAHAHARRMAARRTPFHQDLGVVVRRCGLSLAAENVAVGYSTGRTAVHAAWMPSPGHRTNILERRHRLTGVGAVRDELGVWWTVQLLGRR